MKQKSNLRFLLMGLCSFYFLQSCTKMDTPAAKEAISSQTPIRKQVNVLPTGYYDNPLTDEGNGVYSGYLSGELVRFHNITYEYMYDANGNIVTPKYGDPFYASMELVSPNTSQWSIVISPDLPNNQFAVRIPIASFDYYDAGSRMSEYWSALDASRTNYASQLNTYYYWAGISAWLATATSGQGMVTLNRPTYSPPLIKNYMQLTNTGQAGNEIITGSLIQNGDGTLSMRISETYLQ